MSFFLYIILPSIISPNIFYGKWNRPLDALTCRRGLFWQNLLLRPAVLISPGLILAESLAVPRCFGSVGAYLNKISFCAPLPRDYWGLFWRNLLLSPALPISTGLITAKFLICAPISRYRRGLLRQNSLSVPRYPGIDGAYYSKILICAPISRYRRGLLRQNPYLCPDVQRWRV